MVWSEQGTSVLQQKNLFKKDTPLILKDIVAELVKDNYVEKHAADEFMLASHFGSLDIHPLVLISQQEWPDIKNAKTLLSLETLTIWLAKKHEIKYFRIDPLKVDVTAVTEIMSSAYATRYKILPVKVEANRIIIATAEPNVRSWENELAHITGLKIERVIANPLDISRYLSEFYNVSHSIRRAVSNNKESIPGITNFEQLVELGKSGHLNADDHDVVQIVDWLLQFAFEQRASDIHLEPRREVGNIRFRIDGVMHLVYDMPVSVMMAVTSRLKVLGRMDLAERRRPQDGRIKTLTQNKQEIELRLSTMPTAFGEKMVMRIFDPEILVKDFVGLGLSAKEITGWNKLVTQPHGIVLVTGPTGSGKTTTLYSTLKQLAKPEVNVCTVEDPIEMVEPQFNQMQVQKNIDLDFAAGIRTLMRQDPDIIMVGEIRDLETAEMAIQAALTGHLVLSTLHTNDAAAAIPRLREIGIPAYLINATVNGILAQRLVRTLCPHCKEPTQIDEDIWNSFTHPWKLNGNKTFFKPVGCDECRQTGYLGRAGIYEMMILTPTLRKQITPESDALSIRDLAVKEGMVRLRISGAQKVAMGFTTIEEVLKVIPSDMEL